MPDSQLVKSVSEQLMLPFNSVKVVLTLFEEGCTIPFIARYRKDKTGGMDEVSIAAIQNASKSREDFFKRKQFIIETIREQGKLSAELLKQIEECNDLQGLEDIYLPYKKRRKTKADIAREKGLEPLAKIIFNQRENNIRHLIPKFLNKEVKNAEEALQGARDIIAEWINENPDLRNRLRERFVKYGLLHAKVVKTKIDQAQKYRDYFDYSEKMEHCPSHRIMAVFRGVEEGFLRFEIMPDELANMEFLERQVLKFRNECGEQVKIALVDSWKRLLQPSLETEFKNKLIEKAEIEAIRVFAENLKQLLLSAPLGSKRILAIDPGIRTGCKVVCLDQKGNLLTSDTVFIHTGLTERDKAKITLTELCRKFEIEAFAIGDGTAGRETQQFVQSLQLNIPLFMVNEDGASVYSVSEVARQEFPKQDVTVKGTISIGRRLMDPLAELVKIDPKSIGVGQYQHDVNPLKLKEKLDLTVESCVNMVGVNLNTAGPHLLSYVSGLGPVLAQNIVDYRQKIGKFTSRIQLKEVPRLGSKAFEQCAGFLRIKNGDNPLDGSGVHPENYPIVDKIAKDLNTNTSELIGNERLINSIEISKYINESIGELTLKDILSELRKPGLDPREEATAFQFAGHVMSVKDLKVGMLLPGMVTNITAFGAFVDIGVKQDGLVHVSQLANKFVKDPNEVVKLQQKVLVKVMEVDLDRKRISLSMKDL